MTKQQFISLSKTMIVFFIITSLLSCKNKSTTQIGEIHTNDAYSNKIADLLKAFEAKDSATFSNMYADDFKMLDETQSGWVDNDYFKDTSKGFTKKAMIDGECASLRELNNVKYENPKITSYFFSNSDTITVVKAYYTAISKSDSNKIHNPYFRIFYWKNGKISQMLKYTNKTGSNVFINYYGENNAYYQNPYGYDTQNQYNRSKDSSKIKK